jgi:F-type H+-transporting ATPase subunit a
LGFGKKGALITNWKGVNLQQMEQTPKLGFKLAGIPIQFDVTVMITTTITCILVFIIAMIAARRRSLVPSGMQNLVEMAIEFTQGIVRSNLDSKTSERFYGLAFTLFLYVLIANQLGLMFNVVTEHGHHEAYSWWKSPTADINVPLVMAFTITIVAHFLGIRKSAKKYASHYFKPFWWMFPLHIIEEVAKPVTHGMRLWANIFAGEILVFILMKAPWYLGTPPLIVWLGYSVFVGVIQAYIFTVLAMVYTSQKLSSDH